MTAALQALNDELTGLIRRVLPSTVTIEGYSKDLSENSQGSGWIYAPGLVVTNHHVIDGMANPVTVSPVGRAGITGDVIGSDPENDIAVIRVEGLDGQPLQLEPEPPRLGELCVAIGSPHSYRESASLGIISGLSRQIRLADGTVIEEMIQTDASVNPGNSGGPLVNIHGRIVGMNSMGPAETVNMAVPAETLGAVVPELVSHGSVLRASIGISIAVIEHPVDLGLQRAISVRKVKDADQSPLERGDILLQINGRQLRRRIDVIRALGRETVDQRVTVLIERNGESRTVEVLAKAKTSSRG
ncbi:S1C family serine protease [Synechococcus sp. CBW1006]|uniref:S1C family serine protease n=1 Tax=Synechococcus sp. CBW1006 TaxID=1353138 RepID=UPI0018CF3D2D|nr:trypsin-like peptidase domain-containing protein [Synechococcus sp. CBW1006]QPN66554.1 trypsin-like peptidase domain-containing protein [Synechococcus sp. CBW1006]